jgi:hypothetical protein
MKNTNIQIATTSYVKTRISEIDFYMFSKNHSKSLFKDFGLSNLEYKIDISFFSWKTMANFINWCEEFCKHNWEFNYCYFYFEDKTESIMFALIAK